MLVEMATGSGKSFTQALWALVTSMANVAAILAVPNESLKVQLRKDFEHLLPDEFKGADIIQRIRNYY